MRTQSRHNRTWLREEPELPDLIVCCLAPSPTIFHWLTRHTTMADAFDMAAVTAALPVVETLPVEVMRDGLNEYLMVGRCASVALTLAALAAAATVGAVWGDPIAAGDSRDRPRKLLGGECH